MQIYFLVIILVAFLAIAIVRWVRNEKSPVSVVPATVIAMRRKKHIRAHYRSYHVTFLTGSGEQMELRVNYNDYDMMTTDDKGMLTYQGTRYLGFEKVSV